MSFPVLLLDIDGTLVDGLGQYNQGLLQALQQAQIAHPELHIVLFTAYEWGESLVQKAERGLTRQVVCQVLADHGVRIEAVIISHSNQAEQEPAAFGQYYVKVFQPIEEQLMADPVHDLAHLRAILAHYPEIGQQEAEYKKRNQAIRRIDTQALGGNDNKEPMFRHVLQHYGKGVKFLVVDDSAAVLAAAKHLHEREGYLIQRYLTTVQAYKAGIETADSYLQNFAKAFAWPWVAATPTTAPAPTAELDKNRGLLRRFFGRRSPRETPTPSPSSPPAATSTSSFHS
jgi:hypothetical protein